MPVEKTVPCKICGDPTPMTATKLCNGCWEVDSRIETFITNCQNTDWLKMLRGRITTRIFALTGEAMSGGSFEYLYIKDVDELINRNDLFVHMRNALIEIGAKDVARETEEFRLFLRQIETRAEVYMERLGPVWHVVITVKADDPVMRERLFFAGFMIESPDEKVHPGGRCTCAGEGECEWCKTHCIHCGAGPEHHGPGSIHYFESHGGEK